MGKHGARPISARNWPIARFYLKTSFRAKWPFDAYWGRKYPCWRHVDLPNETQLCYDAIVMGKRMNGKTGIISAARTQVTPRTHASCFVLRASCFVLRASCFDYTRRLDSPVNCLTADISPARSTQFHSPLENPARDPCGRFFIHGKAFGIKTALQDTARCAASF